VGEFEGDVGVRVSLARNTMAGQFLIVHYVILKDKTAPPCFCLCALHAVGLCTRY
jgi:hypothetical protein